MYRREISLYYSNIPPECKQISSFCGKETGVPERVRKPHPGADEGTWRRVYKKITITALQTFKCRRIIRMKIEKRRDVQWRWTSSWQMWMTWFLTVRSRATANGKTGRTTPRGRGFFYAFWGCQKFRLRVIVFLKFFVNVWEKIEKLFTFLCVFKENTA